MTDEHRNNGPADEHFAERLRQAWGRPELSASEAARLDAELIERAGRRTSRFGPILVVSGSLASAAAVALLVLPTEQAKVDWLTPLLEAQAVLDGTVDDERAETRDEWLDWIDPDASRDNELIAFLGEDYRAIDDWLSLAEDPQKNSNSP